MRKTLIPPLSGVFSALGLLLARPSSDAGRTVMVEEESLQLDGIVSAIEAEAADTFSKDHGGPGGRSISMGEVRYRGQSHELAVPLARTWPEIRRVFEADHRARFGFVRDGESIELVNVTASVMGQAPLSWSDLPHLTGGKQPVPTPATSMLGDRVVDVDVWSRADLPAGFEARGPAVIVEPDSAVWLEPDDAMVVHADGTLEIES
jgi:N-methylhydantoinase A